MASDDLADSSRSSRRPRPDLGEEDEIEEGEFVAGSDTDDDSRYVFQHRRDGVDDEEGRPQIKRRRLEDIVLDGGALPSPTPSCECDSDGTISDIDADEAGAAALARKMSSPCPVCRRRFKSEKARCGHMRKHGPKGRQQGNRERPVVAPVISAGWAVTGKRGSVGGRSVSPESEGVVDSMAIVVAEPVIDPMPIAFASRSSSAEPSPPNDASTAVVFPSQNKMIVHQTCSPQFVTGHQPVAPRVTQVSVANNPQPAFTQGQLAAAPPQIFQPAAHQVRRAAPPARDEQGWWVCKEEGCHQRYATHQGLGGHMAGHKNRQNNAGLHLGVGDAAKPAKLHTCKICFKVFTSGVKLGGHMRKHYPGKVIPKKRGAGAIPQVSARELASAYAPSLTMPPATRGVAPAVSSVTEVAPVVPPGAVRLFGVNIVPAGPPAAAAAAAGAAEKASSAVPPAAAAAEEVSSAVPPSAAPAEEVSSTVPPAAAAAEEVSSAVTETDQSSAASTTNIQEP